MTSNSYSWKSSCCADRGGALGIARRAFRRLVFIIALLVPSGIVHAQQSASFHASDGALIYADEYGSGARGVLLAHGGQFNKESWRDQAQSLVAAGFHVLAFDFRGFGKSQGPGQADLDTAPLKLDVLAAIAYLRQHGAQSIDVIGASMGGSAAGGAIIGSPPGLVHRLVLLGTAPDGDAAQLKCPSLFIVARDDANGDGPRLPRIRVQYEKAPKPKRLVIVDGSAHAQFMFQSAQGARVMQEIMRFLQAAPPLN
jgi:pimeloyl-ACP methyl ester carboxylesterase